MHWYWWLLIYWVFGLGFAIWAVNRHPDKYRTDAVTEFVGLLVVSLVWPPIFIFAILSRILK